MTNNDALVGELLPCPVCGDKPKWRGSRHDYAAGIYRLQCLGETHLFQAYGASEEKCIAAWNARPPLTPQPEADSKLLMHFTRMQEAAANYVEPTTYVARHPVDKGVSLCKWNTEFPMPEPTHAPEAVASITTRRDQAFINDMIYMLDRPEQREAQATPLDLPAQDEEVPPPDGVPVEVWREMQQILHETIAGAYERYGVVAVAQDAHATDAMKTAAKDALASWLALPDDQRSEEHPWIQGFNAGWTAALDGQEDVDPPAQDEVEVVARSISAAHGDCFDSAFNNKREWAANRGEKGGRFRDINEPMQSDYLDMATAAIAALDRHRGTDALREENARLRGALRDASVSLWWAARQMKGNCNGSAVDAVNLAAENASSPASLTGRQG